MEKLFIFDLKSSKSQKHIQSVIILTIFYETLIFIVNSPIGIWVRQSGQLKKAIINPLGTDALFVTEFYGGAGTAERSADLMDIIARLKKGDRLYIGAILGYHN